MTTRKQMLRDSDNQASLEIYKIIARTGTILAVKNGRLFGTEKTHLTDEETARLARFICALDQKLDAEEITLDSYYARILAYRNALVTKVRQAAAEQAQATSKPKRFAYPR